VISSSHRPLPTQIQETQGEKIHDVSWIRNHDPSIPTTAEPCLMPYGQWDQPHSPITAEKPHFSQKILLITLLYQMFKLAHFTVQR